MWALNSKLTSPKHSFGIYSYNEKSASRKKLGGVGGALKPAKAAKALPVDNISRIANKVDNMTIENEKSENKNEDINLKKICSRITDKMDFMSIGNTNRKDDENKNEEFFEKVSSRTPSLSLFNSNREFFFKHYLFRISYFAGFFEFGKLFFFRTIFFRRTG